MLFLSITPMCRSWSCDRVLPGKVGGPPRAQCPGGQRIWQGRTPAGAGGEMRQYIYTQAQKETCGERWMCFCACLSSCACLNRGLVDVQVSLPMIVYGRSHHVRILVAVGYSVIVSIVTALQFLRPLAANVYATAAYRYTHNGHTKPPYVHSCYLAVDTHSLCV